MHDYVAPYRELAQHFDMKLSAPTEGTGAAFQVVVLDGAFEGVPAHVYRATGTDARYSYVWVRATRRVPGDLGLSVTQTNPAASLFARLFDSGRIRLGDEDGPPGFDSSFAVKGAEPARVRALLTADVRSVLLAWLNAVRADASRHSSLLWGLWADDEHVYLELQPEAWKWKMFDRQIAIDELANALRAVTSLARAFDAAAAHVPPSAVLARHVAAWRSFAEARNLGFSPSPLRMSGQLGDAPFVARAVATAKAEYDVELRRPFEQPLSFFLRLKPYKRFDFYSWDPDGPHERLGDAAFDDAFNVVTSDVARTRAFLSEPVRRTLLELHEAGESAFIDPDGVFLHRKDMAPDAFEAALRRLDVIANRR